MVNEQRCTACGCELPLESLHGHCPDCLLKAGLPPEPQSDDLNPTLDSPHGQADYTPPTAAELTTQLPQLEVVELLGYGGMGAVYKARQKSLDRVVALKIIKADLASVQGFADRFAREAKALARLNHPNIVGVHDFGEVNGQFYLVMEFVDGTDLRRLMATKELKPEQAISIVPQICEALQYAHDNGIVHRDIKPENILFDSRGQVKIADFGLAKLLGDSGRDHELTATNQVMGTLKYMAPEQMEGAASIDHRADIYSLGVVFYELLTGDVPLGRFVAPSEKAAIDQRLDEIVMRALERELPHRYQHASDMQVEVERLSTPTGKPRVDSDKVAPSSPQAPYPVARQSSALGSTETHVRILAAINIGFGGLFLVLAAIVFFVMPSIGLASQDEEAMRVLSIIGAVGAGILTVLGLPGLLIGVGLWKFEPWSRFAGIILGAINLINVPIGTVLGIYTIWVLVSDEATQLFHRER